MATNTTATATTHTGNGSTTNFAISFSFLANNEVDVTVAGVLKTLDTHYTISGSTVTFTSGNIPASGAAVKFQRDTNISAKKVDFQDGSVLTETDLDTNSDQVLFAQQEITDKLNGIEEGATADQTNAEIRAAVEAATDSNVFTDADHTKLNGIETAATADQTAAEIRTLVESASDSNVFTDADHTKLNAIEASATADQTAAEIRTLVESASDSNVFTDADHTKLNAIEANATADQTVSEIKSLIAGSPLDASHLAANSVDSSELVDGSIDHSHLSNDCVDGDNIADNSIGAEHLQANSVDSSELVDGSIDTSHLSADCVDGTKIADNAIGSEHLAANSVGTSEIADAELTTLAGMQSGTASKLADSTALTADLADLNQLDGMAKQTTLTDDDTKFPTSGAVVDYVAAQIAPIGGLEVIATDAAFPNTQPASGVVISIADAGGLVVNGSGTSTTGRTVGGSTVTINNFASNFNSSTVDAGVAIMVSSTGSGQIYNYHKATLKEADLLSLSNDINDFAARYRVTNGEPTSNNDEGDLIYDTQADKMKVYDSTTSAFKEVTSVGDFKFLFLCPTGGSGSPTINGSIATYDLREASNSGAAASVTNAAQLLVSINGVVQKPNTGTSAPSEGFAMVDTNTIIFGTNLPTGAEVFVIQIGSAVSLQVPADNTVSSAKIQNGSVIQSKLADQAVNEAKLQVSNAPTNGYFLSAQSGNTGGLTWAAVSTDLVADTSPQLGGDLQSNGNDIDFADNDKAIFGTGGDLKIDHNGTRSKIENITGDLKLSSNSIKLTNYDDDETYLTCADDGAVELYYDNSKKLETTSTGFSSIDNLYFIRNSGTDQMLCIGTDNTATAQWSTHRQGLKIAGNNPVLYFHDTDNSYEAYVGGSNGGIYIGSTNNGMVRFQTGTGATTSNRWYMNGDGHFYPAANNSYDIGTTSYRVRNIYTNDLNLSNEGGANDVDGTWGSYTIQEGAEDLFLVNKRNGKKYKFNLTEVS